MLDIGTKIYASNEVEIQAINPNFNENTFERLHIRIKDSDKLIVVYPESPGAYRDPVLWCADLKIQEDP